MRIAQIAPLWERVPPPAYGGIELVVGLLCDELVRRGHEVTLFAAGDSITLAKLESVHPQAIRLDPSVKDYSIYELWQVSKVYEKASEFDIIHSHVGHTALPYANLVKTPSIHTIHNAFTPDTEKLYTHARNQAYISISNAHREPRLNLNYVGTVYNGINTSIYKFYEKPQNPPYLAFLGRLSPNKGPHLAIGIAKRYGLPLKIAGKIDNCDREYFAELIEPHIDGKQIQYLGEANHAQKTELMGNAVVTLFPITWREPFGLVMIESMACGTPVIAMAMGSTPEIIAHGKSGFLCHSVDECVAAIDKAMQLNRHACRDYVVSKFSDQQMTDGYEAVYRQLLKQKFAKNGHIRNLSLRAM